LTVSEKIVKNQIKNRNPLDKGDFFYYNKEKDRGAHDKSTGGVKSSQDIAAPKGDCAEVCRSERHSGRTVKSRFTVAFLRRAIGHRIAIFGEFLCVTRAEPQNSALFYVYFSERNVK